MRVVRHRQGQQVACIEEAAFRMGYFQGGELEILIAGLGKTGYAGYLRRLIEETGEN